MGCSDESVDGAGGLKGKPVAEMCTAHQTRQSPYYQGRDQVLANAAKAFEVQQHTR
jgi:hypothetical protein